MKRVILGVVAIAVVAAGAAWAAPVKTVKHTPVKAEGYHHLLMLDLKEAAEHARLLQHYADAHASKLEKPVLEKHVAEIAKNLDGAQTEMKDLDENLPAKDKSTVEAQLTSIRTQQETAMTDLDALKAEVAKEAPDAKVISQKAKAIRTAMMAAHQHHQKAMAKRNMKMPVEKPPKS